MELHVLCDLWGVSIWCHWYQYLLTMQEYGASTHKVFDMVFRSNGAFTKYE